MARREDSALRPDELRGAGEALWGHRWQTEMAAALGVRDSARIREWLRGARPIPAAIRAELVALMRARASELTRAAKLLGAVHRPPAHVVIAEAPTDRPLGSKTRPPQT